MLVLGNITGYLQKPNGNARRAEALTVNYFPGAMRCRKRFLTTQRAGKKGQSRWPGMLPTDSVYMTSAKTYMSGVTTGIRPITTRVLRSAIRLDRLPGEGVLHAEAHGGTISK